VSRAAAESSADPHVERLARLFREHPAWREAARHVSDETTSRVLFRHRPGERWHLERRDGESLLLPGDAADPDFVFRFAPAAIDRLAAAGGSIGAFAVTLFELIASDDAEARVDFRVAAPFARLVQRGYVRLLLAAGWRVLAFGARRGVRTLEDLRRLVARLQASGEAPWEADADRSGGADDDPALRRTVR
jgi:hypothetical protein